MQGSHLIANLDQLVALEFEQLATSSAVQVIVLGIAVVVIVNGTAVELKAKQKTGVDAFT